MISSPLRQLLPSSGRGQRVLLIVMPWAPAQFPAVGPTLLRSILIRDGLECDILYANIVFSKLMENDAAIEKLIITLPISEVAFTPFYFGTPVIEAAQLLYDNIAPFSSDPSHYPLQRFEKVVQAAGECLDQLISEIDWAHYDVVGFSVMMQQTVPSIALAKKLKQLHPNIKIVFGGANASVPMGRAMLRAFPEIDYVVEGEADAVITPLVRSVRSGERPTVPGVSYRNAAGEFCQSADSQPFYELDSLPVPDYGPFFEQVRVLDLQYITPFVPFETSRGCWWGAKHHCTFCGIGDDVMKFRSKSEDVIFDEILSLSANNMLPDLFAVDSIINYQFYRSLLPQLATLRERHDLDLSFFFECKSNIRREQAFLFRNGGVREVQPGIESFDDHVLSLMNKGTTAARQIQCLKLLAENGIEAAWNLIYKNPGETADDYREIVHAIPFVHHLPPVHEHGLIPMQVSRYAPYHNAPERYGIKNVRPHDYYKSLFPSDHVEINDLAFYFAYDAVEPPTEELNALYSELQEAIDVWRKSYRPNSLVQLRGPGFVRVIDRRLTSS